MEPVFRYEKHKLKGTRSLGGNVYFLSNQSLGKKTGQEIITLESEVNDDSRRLCGRKQSFLSSLQPRPPSLFHPEWVLPAFKTPWSITPFPSAAQTSSHRHLRPILNEESPVLRFLMLSRVLVSPWTPAKLNSEFGLLIYVPDIWQLPQMFLGPC